MSRDQRPGRVKMIDNAPAALPARRVGEVPGPATATAAAVIDAAEPALPELAAPKSRTILWSGLFLLACIAGATGVTLLPLLGIG